jgi:hypothetical protein
MLSPAGLAAPVNTQWRDTRLKMRRIAGTGTAFAVLAVLLSACGGSASGSTPTAAPAATRVPVTPIAAPLVAYGSYTNPILKTSITEVRQVMTRFHKPDFETLGDQCSLAGGDLSNQQTSFHGAFAPSLTARLVFRKAESGYKLVLSAMDECGMAADQRSKSQLSTADKDMKNGLNDLVRAEASTAHWESGKT